MRGSLRLHLFGSLVLLPVLVASVVTFFAVRLFREDKEIYVYDLSAQSVELVARNLSARLESLRLKATHEPDGLSVERRGGDAFDRPTYTIERMGADRLRVEVRGSGGGRLTMKIPPEALLDLRGFSGPTELMVVNRAGQVLVHPDPKRFHALRVDDLLRQLKPFKRHGARAGTREVRFTGRPTLAAYAVVGDNLAVLQTLDKAQVSAAAKPLVTSAIVASLLVVLVAILVALVLGRSILRPLRLVSEQAEAIGRGEFGVAVKTQSAAELAQLVDSFNAMSAALKRREEELSAMQRQLLQAERLNASGRMIAAIVKELSEPLERCFNLASQTHHRLPESSSLRTTQKQIMDEANRAANILQNLARLASREDSPADAVEPDIIVSDVLVSSRPLFEKQQLSVTTDLDTGVGRVRISPEQLRSALLDVFLYVSKHARPEGPVQVNLRSNDGKVTLDVAYSGTPLSEEERGNLLRPSTAAETGGLELAVAATVFEEQGGGLALEPTERGNRISISLLVA